MMPEADAATAIAFVQIDAQTFAFVEAPLVPAARPVPGRAAFLAPRFSLEGGPWWLTARGDEIRRVSVGEWERLFPATPALHTSPRWLAAEQRRFREGFETLQARLADGRLRKGVPITRTRACLDAGQAEALFRRLAARVPALPKGLVAYGLFLPGDRSAGPEFLIGATPEILFDIEEEGRRVRTWAVAGTRRAEPGAGRALAESAKERAEHWEVVDDLLAQARRVGSPVAGPTIVRRFGSLLHLVTEIDVRPANLADFEDLVRALHPTPALGVSPRGSEGDSWLRGLDPGGERRRFGAPFGIRWPSGDGRAAVAIRGLQYFQGHLVIWAGCGVVASSDYAAEWAEALDKLESVRTLWGI